MSASCLSGRSLTRMLQSGWDFMKIIKSIQHYSIIKCKSCQNSLYSLNMKKFSFDSAQMIIEFYKLTMGKRKSNKTRYWLFVNADMHSWQLFENWTVIKRRLQCFFCLVPLLPLSTTHANAAVCDYNTSKGTDFKTISKIFEINTLDDP